MRSLTSHHLSGGVHGGVGLQSWTSHRVHGGMGWRHRLRRVLRPRCWLLLLLMLLLLLVLVLVLVLLLVLVVLLVLLVLVLVLLLCWRRHWLLLQLLLHVGWRGDRLVRSLRLR